MAVSRRTFLNAAALMPALFARSALAQTGKPAMPPIVFVHGNGDHAALWQTVLWRFETNGWPGAHLHAFNFTDPQSRVDNTVPQPGRSGTDDQLRELMAEVEAVKALTGQPRVALVGSSRGGNAIRNYVVHNGGSASVSHAVLCGTPNRGVYDWESSPNGEFNGRGPFLKMLNGGESDVVPGTAFLTLRSDGNDKFAQPDGRFVGAPGKPTGITFAGPELRGATNLVLGQLDHREVAFHPRAFREIYRFITGVEPARIAIQPQAAITLDGLVTGTPEGIASNRPVPGAKVQVWRVSGETGERIGDVLLEKTVGADGRWGPVTLEPTGAVEFVVDAAGYPTTHIFRSAFPRSSSVVHLRPARVLSEAERISGSVLLFTRPRGYFGLPRDVIIFDGKEPTDIARGVATNAETTLRLPLSDVGRAVLAQFNDERVVARAWPAGENRVVVAELTY